MVSLVSRHIPELVAAPVVAADSLFFFFSFFSINVAKTKEPVGDSGTPLVISQTVSLVWEEQRTPFLCWTCVVWFVLLVFCHFCCRLYIKLPPRGQWSCLCVLKKQPADAGYLTCLERAVWTGSRSLRFKLLFQVSVTAPWWGMGGENDHLGLDSCFTASPRLQQHHTNFWSD